MNMRSLERQIARARLTAMGVGNVNKKMSNQRKNRDGIPLENKMWKRVLFGDLARRGEVAINKQKWQKSRKLRRVGK